YPSKLTANTEKQEIIIEGLRFQSSQGQKIEEKRKKYTLKYLILNGRFYINGIKETE
ncbi:MAG: hypothetical protein HQK79_22615, partial [Desulfobacterales bacterium]|nr:hypothetical protein [Desulfobacterales bacterium]